MNGGCKGLVRYSELTERNVHLKLRNLYTVFLQLYYLKNENVWN